jgi:acetyl-CoA carboxylase biotin carboxyl carrier protein
MPVYTAPSPLPGGFYRRPSPQWAVFKEIGDTAAVGDTVGLIEVMGSFTPCTADAAGKIVAFHVEDED